MAPAPPPIKLPASYAELPLQDIRVSHYPESSPTPTPIVILTLYRPGRHNAFTQQMTQELEQVFAMFDVDDRVKCIIVTGHGKIFCAGADLGTGFNRSEEKTNEHRDGYVNGLCASIVSVLTQFAAEVASLSPSTTAASQP
jgi:enoyl-CoA hydratase/carnithine racemase